jgi:hypothetical protein
MMGASYPHSTPSLTSDDELFLLLLRATLTAICERLGFVNRDDDFEPLALSNTAEELISLISLLQLRREASL